jgi:glucose/arabinose dehydrogenase
MHTSTSRLFTILACAALAGSLPTSAEQTVAPLPQLKLPAGFQAEVYAEKVDNARSMVLGPQGTVFVGSQYAGKVHAVVDSDGDRKADKVVVIASGLDQPNGVAMRNGALYVATASRLLRFDDIEKHLDAPPTPVTVRDDLPNPKSGHTWKFIAFGPDDMLYMSVGAPCNVCLSPPLVSAIVRMKPDGTGTEVFADGVRNSVGFDWHPVTRELWFTDNGRDGLGDDVPDDELNIAPKAGLHFGFPFCCGSAVRLPAGVFDDRASSSEARRACGGHRLHVLHRQDVSGQLSERGDHRPARVVEPIDSQRLSRDGRVNGWTTRYELSATRGRFPAGGRSRRTWRDHRSERPSRRRAATA